MPASEAQIAANRRNAQKSTGPRTEEGKKRSSMNALKFGHRAETLVLPGEDTQELDERRAAWTASLGPRCELEQRAVDQAVIYSWRQDRAWRAEAKRAHARLDELSDEDPAATAAGQEVARDLGRQLFTDRLGSIMYYPFTDDQPKTGPSRDASTSYPSKFTNKKLVETLPPDVIVVRLKSTLAGCEWLLAEWKRLKTVIEDGQPWIVQDKLKAIRLLGRQPFDVLDDRDVAMIYLASHQIKPQGPEWAWEIHTEMNEEQKKRFRDNVADRQLEALLPATADDARDVLLALVGRQIEWLTARADAHRQRERAKTARLASCLDFDDSVEGERLRRFETSSGRGYNRAIDSFLKFRKEEPGRTNDDRECGDMGISGSSDWGSEPDGLLSDAADPADAIAEPNAPCKSEPAADVDISWALEIDTDALHGIHRNEPNEVTAVHENVTNEAKCFSSQIDVNHYPDTDFAGGTDRAAEKNEAKVDEPSAKGGDEPSEYTVVTGEELYELIVAHFPAVDSHRAERLRKLNEESREINQGARATRQSRRRFNPTPVAKEKKPRARRKARSPVPGGSYIP
jgi:hypothetical protein